MTRNLLVLHTLSVSIVLVVSLSSCQKRISPQPTGMVMNERTRLMLDEQHNVTPSVQALMKLSGLQETADLHEAVVLTQKSWLRGPGLERMHLSELHIERAQEMRSHFERLGLVSAIMPKEKHYDYVLLLGAAYRTIKGRLTFLESLARRGLSFSTLALLGSHRPLERFHEIEPIINEEHFAHVPLTEIELMEALLSHSQWKTMDKQHVLSVASPMKRLANNQFTRATTLDTVIDFLRLNQRAGSVLVISNQPFVLRQHLVVQHALGPKWHVETVGDAAQVALTTSVYLDELARTLYQIETITTK